MKDLVAVPKDVYEGMEKVLETAHALVVEGNPDLVSFRMESLVEAVEGADKVIEKAFLEERVS